MSLAGPAGERGEQGGGGWQGGGVDAGGRHGRKDRARGLHYMLAAGAANGEDSSGALIKEREEARRESERKGGRLEAEAKETSGSAGRVRIGERE